MEDPEQRARASVRTSAIIYATLLGAVLVFLSYFGPGLAGGFGYVSLSVAGIVGLLLAYQVLQHVRDLQAPLAESDGTLVRKWKRADLIVAMQSFYITVDRVIFRVKAEDWAIVDEGMYVKVVHFPHTLNVVSIHELKRPQEPPAK